MATWQATLNFLLDQKPNDLAGLPPVGRRFYRHRPLTVDGVFGPLTASLTRAYQQAFHLRATGRVGFDTWRVWAGSEITCCGTGYPTLIPGDWSQYVTWWQASLDDWLKHDEPNMPQLIPDGVYGPLTTAATALYQSSVGLAPDGIAGPRTWTRLMVSGFNLY